MTEPMYVGVDVGTSLAKAAAFDAAGELLAVATRPVPLLHPAPGQVEQDPELIVDCVHQVLAEVCDSTGVSRPELVAITGQGDGCWLVDEAGKPVRPGISWMDGRAGSIVKSWDDAGISRAIFADNGNMMFPGAAAPILAWLDRNEPATLDGATTAGYVKDLVLQRFTGVRGTDATDASLPFGALGPDTSTTPGADTSTTPAADTCTTSAADMSTTPGDASPGQDYSAEVLRLTGLQHRSHLLAPVLRPLPIGAVVEPGASGLESGVTMVAAPYDIPACAIGSGVLQPGDGLLIAGTTLACSVLTDRPDTSGTAAGMTITMPEPGRWLRVMAAMVGTACLDWATEALGVPLAEVNDLIDAVPAGSNGVEVLPYLAPSGERAPFVDPAARAQFSGVSLTTTRGDLIRGLCEGLAYAARSCFEAAGLTGDVYVCGGGTRSQAWMQIFASVLGSPMLLARPDEVGARGAVLAAAQAVGHRLDAAAWTGPARVIAPIPADVEVYQGGYRRFGELLAAARPLWKAVRTP